MAGGTWCACGNEINPNRPKLFRMTYKPCSCKEPGIFIPSDLGTTGTLMRGQAYRCKDRERLGLPDVSKDGGGILKGSFWE